MQPDEYRKLAEAEDSMWYFRALRRHVGRALARIAANSDVLDAGCGTGGLILNLRAIHPRQRWSGIDVSPLAVELARQRCGPGVDLREGSITDLPFASGAFDAVVSADVICQVENPERALEEFYRVLRPGGVLVINVPAYMWMWSYHDDTWQTKHRYTRGELANLLAQAGFSGARFTHWNLFAFPFIFAKRKLFSSSRDTSDLRNYPPPVEAMFRAMTGAEQFWLGSGGTIPFGTSVFSLAEKPN